MAEVVAEGETHYCRWGELEEVEEGVMSGRRRLDSESAWEGVVAGEAEVDRASAMRFQEDSRWGLVCV